jgi:hypothetical protein
MQCCSHELSVLDLYANLIRSMFSRYTSSSLFIKRIEIITIVVITYLGFCVTYGRVLDWMIGFIDTWKYRNYSAIAVPTLYSSPLHTHTSVLSL